VITYGFGNSFDMMVKSAHIFNDNGNYRAMRHPLINRIAFISLLGFFLAFMAISLHHHDNAFWLRSCSICKINASISGALSKIKVDSAPAVNSIQLLFTTTFLCLSGILPDSKTIFIDSQIAVTYLNKAPPFNS